MILDWYERQNRFVRWWFAAIVTPFVLIAAAFIVVALVWLTSLPYAWPVIGWSTIAGCLVTCVHQALEDL